MSILWTPRQLRVAHRNGRSSPCLNTFWFSRKNSLRMWRSQPNARQAVLFGCFVRNCGSHSLLGFCDKSSISAQSGAPCISNRPVPLLRSRWCMKPSASVSFWLGPSPCNRSFSRSQLPWLSGPTITSSTPCRWLPLPPRFLLSMSVPWTRCIASPKSFDRSPARILISFQASSLVFLTYANSAGCIWSFAPMCWQVAIWGFFCCSKGFLRAA
jgi:hypothetical protein